MLVERHLFSSSVGLCFILISFCNRDVRGQIYPDTSGCTSHPETLSVECKHLNRSLLSGELQRELSHSLWVQDLKIIDAKLPVLNELIPKSVPSLLHLQVLHVVRSHVVQVRTETMLQVAANLRHLSLAHNKLVGVPAAISLLEGLEVLDLRHNAITRISALVSRLPRLRTLKLDHNRIRQLIGWGTQTSPMIHLTLADNFIHEVWSESLESFPSLQYLDLSQNLLQRLPTKIDFQSSLIELDLRGNPWHCDCQSSWLTRFQYQQDDSNSLLLSLPLCSSPENLRKQPLGAFTDEELCSQKDLENRTIGSIGNDLNNNHINLTDIGPRHFQLSWNVSHLSSKERKVEEYLGWRVTFRPFGEEKESEVLLITLARQSARRKTRTTSGQYSIRNLTPSTGYHLCFQTLTDGEVNNIIESRRRTTKDRIPPVSSRVHGSDTNLRARSVDGSRASENTFRSDWNDLWKNEFIPTTENQLETEPTTEFVPTTTEEETTHLPSAENFVYTSDGHRIPINFAPPFNHPTDPFFEDEGNGDFGLRNPFAFNNNNPSIPNVPPPPPPTTFGESREPFHLPFVRRRRETITVSKNEYTRKGRCMEVVTEEEDEIVMPVTVAATASSSTTLVIFMICCCCFPKRCNRMRDCCIDKCKSVKDKTLIKKNSKTKTFVKPKKSAPYKQNISISTPDLRILEKDNKIEKEYRYQNLNKFNTVRISNMVNSKIELYPGYDFPKSATAKYFGYDFPKTSVYSKLPTSPKDNNGDRRMSTDDNTSPVIHDRFVYYNLNKVRANLDIPAEHSKYSDKIKGLKYSIPPMNIVNNKNYQNSFDTFKKISNDVQFNREKPSPNIKAKRVRSNSESDIPSKFDSFTNRQPFYYNLLSKDTINMNKISNSYKIISLSQELRLEKVREFHQKRPERPTILNIKPTKNYDDHFHPSFAYSETDNTSQNECFLTPTYNKSITPVGEVAVTGGTLVEVPEGYVTPAKPRPINVLRLQVPAEFNYNEV